MLKSLRQCHISINPQAVAIYQRIDKLARKAKTPGDDRSADARRADAFADLLLGYGSAVQVEMQVTVPATTLMGISNEPGQLEGYGAVSAELARAIATDARWPRLLTDPKDG